MRVLVTGGAGYVGWSVVHELAQRDGVDEIVIYDNFARRNYGLLLGDKPTGKANIRVVVDDILNSRALKKAMQGIDCVCHLAAIAPSPDIDESPHRFDQVNHWGTAEVCYAVEATGVPKMVYLSSGAVYGHPEGIAGVETEPMPVNAYGRSKRAGEKQVERLAKQLEVAIIRSGTVYGVNPAARFDTFVNRFLLDAALGRALNVNGSGDQVRPIIYVQLLAKMVGEAVVGKPEGLLAHAVEENIGINDVVTALKGTDPSIDEIHINQQQVLPDLQLTPLPTLESRKGSYHRRLIDDLLRIRVGQAVTE